MKCNVETCMKWLNNKEVKHKEAEKRHNLEISFNEMKNESVTLADAEIKLGEINK